MALRDAEVQPPNTAATQSLVMSFSAFSAKTVGSDWPSSWILDDLELLAEDAAVGVDLVGREGERVGDGLLGDGHGAGQRVEEADLDGVARGVDAALGGGGLAGGVAALGPRAARGEHEREGDEGGCRGEAGRGA
jgi:hypothetical protein